MIDERPIGEGRGFVQGLRVQSDAALREQAERQIIDEPPRRTAAPYYVIRSNARALTPGKGSAPWRHERFDTVSDALQAIYLSAIAWSKSTGYTPDTVLGNPNHIANALTIVRCVETSVLEETALS